MAQLQVIYQGVLSTIRLRLDLGLLDGPGQQFQEQFFFISTIYKFFLPYTVFSHIVSALE